jgi:transposase InsO family protein
MDRSPDDSNESRQRTGNEQGDKGTRKQDEEEHNQHKAQQRTSKGSSNEHNLDTEPLRDRNANASAMFKLNANPAAADVDQLVQQTKRDVQGTPLEKLNWDTMIPELLEGAGEQGVTRVKEFMMRPNIARVFSDEQYPAKKDSYVPTPMTMKPGAVPRKHGYRRYPYQHQQVIKQKVHELLKQGRIKPSDSPWAAAVVLTSKKDGGLRFAIDYRMVNAATESLSYPLPRCVDLTDRLEGSTYFSLVDAKDGFWNLNLHEDDQKKTAFATPDGLFHWVVLPMGLKNASALFSQFMTEVVGRGLQSECVLCFIDDCLVHSRGTLDEHISCVERLLERFAEWGVSLKPAKCKLFLQEVEFLGHRVTRNGIRMQQDKVKAILDMPPPDTPQKLSAFLGLVGYYRKYVKGFAALAKPLFDKTRGVTKRRYPACTPAELNEREAAAFTAIKKQIARDPILGFPDWTLPFEIHTDACEYGLGATLVQRHPITNKETVIAFASRSLRPGETAKQLDQYRLEALAVRWAVETFRPYVALTTFTVVTDNREVSRLLTKESGVDHDDLLAKVVTYLQGYDVTLQHRAGKKHGSADGLSRNPLPNETPTGPARPVVMGTMQTRNAKLGETNPETEFETNPSTDHGLYDDDSSDEEERATDRAEHDRFNEQLQKEDERAAALQLTMEESERPIRALDLHPLDDETFRRAQWADPKIEKMMERWNSLYDMTDQERLDLYEDERNPQTGMESNDETADWMGNDHNERAWKECLRRVKEKKTKTITTEKEESQDGNDRLRTDSEIFFRGHEFTNGVFYSNMDAERIIVPTSMVESVLSHFHGSFIRGHLGANKTYATMRELFQWRGMRRDVRKYINACKACQARKPTRRLKHGMTRSLVATRPWQICCIDFFGNWPESTEGYKYLLTIHCMFTRWPIAVPMKEKSAAAVALAIVHHVVYQHGAPELIWSDREPGFAAEAMKIIARRFGSNKSETTGYQPQANSSLERFHTYLAQAMTLVRTKHAKDWPQWVEPVLFMYRIAQNETTGYSPFFLTYGRQPRLPVAAMTGVRSDQRFQSEGEYTLVLSGALEEAYTRARQAQEQQKRKDKTRRDAGRHENEPGDLPRGALAMYWQPTAGFYEDEAGKLFTPVDKGEAALLPQKLQNRWTGPHRVVAACQCNDHRYILHMPARKVVKANINRLREFRPWTIDCPTTDTATTRGPASSNTDEADEQCREQPPAEGDVTTFHNAEDVAIIPVDDKDEPFLVVKILRRRPGHAKGHLVQIFGNTQGKREGPYLPGWLQPDKGKSGKLGTGTAKRWKHYFKATRNNANHNPYTNDTRTLCVFDSNFADIRVSLTNTQCLDSALTAALKAHPLVPWH